MQASPADHPAVKKVVVIGPECTGKSDLSHFLADHFKTACVDEYARAYLSKLSKPYEQPDLTKIAHGQSRMEEEWSVDANQVLICDTNAIVIKVWSEHKYGACDPEIIRQITEHPCHLYLLTYIDIPWQEDPLREHPDKREHFWNIFRDEVEKSGVPFVEIRGTREERRSKAVESVNQLIQKIA